VDEAYVRNYRKLYAEHWWWRAREDLILDSLARLRPNGNWGSILDVGCGDGLFFGKLQTLGSVEGIEMDPRGVSDSSPWLPQIQVRSFDETFRPEKLYSLILMLDVLEHFADPSARLARALALLQPDGILLLTVPAFRGLWTSHDDLNHHYTRYTKAELASLVRGSGGRVVESRYFFHWTAPLKLAAHVFERFFPARPSSPRVPAGWINRGLYRLSRAEQPIGRRLSVPFGSSLLTIVVRQDA
jgi:2-polyprenyl-3-methyl-5-hydroxy-6-metoxy-1,4-benzoquinol methylase